MKGGIIINTKSVLSQINPDTFLQDYLKAFGIDEHSFQQFMKPTQANETRPESYVNMNKCLEFIMEVKMVSHTNPDQPCVGILQDSDCDGLCSAVIMYDFLKRFCGVKPLVFFHTGKQHGIRPSKETDDEQMIQQIIDSGVKYLIEPDAGSNDYEGHKILQKNGIETLVLDHHNLENLDKDPIAIIVNNQHPDNSEGKVNKALSGTGVTYLACKYVYDRLNSPDEPLPFWYQQLVAMSIVSDICNITTMENRYYIYNHLAHADLDRDDGNLAFELMIEKLVRRGMTCEGISWGCVPPINALMRSNNQEGKELLFRAFVGEERPEKAVTVCRAAHREQTAIVKELFEYILPKVDTSHNVVIGYIDNDYKNYTGLLANKLLSHFGKPALILREVNSITYSGSVRSPIPVATLLNQTKYAQCQGHEEACGISIKKSNLHKIIKWFDELELSTNPSIEVAGDLATKQINLDLAKQVFNHADLWGHGLPKPLFTTYILYDPYSNGLQCFRKKTTTLKFTDNGIAFLKFSANAEDEEMFSNPPKGTVLKVLFSLEVNEYNGNQTPQCLIEDYEFVDGTSGEVVIDGQVSKDEQEFKELF